MVFTLLTGLAAGAAATAWDERQIVIAAGATLLFQGLAILTFLLGSRRKRSARPIRQDDPQKTG
jgi:hypothetical protein